MDPRERENEECFALYDLFSGIQGEGTWTGRAMLFLRFSGCPLACTWCDEPRHKDPQAAHSLTAQEILETLRRIDPNLFHVLLTGGEPLAANSIVSLVQFLKKKGYWLAMETSGVGGPIPPGLDWVTLSPKTPLSEAIFARADEIKYIVGAASSTQQEIAIQQRAKTHGNVWVQPQGIGITQARKERLHSNNQALDCSEPDLGRVGLDPNALLQCLASIKNSGGKIRLSLQTHKLVGLP